MDACGDCPEVICISLRFRAVTQFPTRSVRKEDEVAHTFWCHDSTNKGAILHWNGRGNRNTMSLEVQKCFYFIENIRKRTPLVTIDAQNILIVLRQYEKCIIEPTMEKETCRRW